MTIGQPRNTRRATLHQLTEVYTEGFSAWEQGIQVGSYGVVIEGEAQSTEADRLPDGVKQCLKTARLVAMYAAVKALPGTERVRIHTRCANLVADLTTRLNRLEDLAWSTHEQGSIMEALVSLLRRRKGYTTFAITDKSKMTSAGHKAHALAKESVEKPRPGLMYIAPRDSTRLPGARLAALTQSDFYRLILRQKRPKMARRDATDRTMAKTKEAVRRRTGRTPSTEEVWLSLRTKSIQTKKTRAFLWKGLHGAVPCGGMWLKIPGHEPKAECTFCNETESIEHVLERCKGNGQKWAWELTAKALRRRGIKDPPTGVPDILGCALPRYLEETSNLEGPERPDEGRNRLYTKLVAETAYLIWTTRCMWQIEHEGKAEKIIGKREMRNRWLKMVNDLLVTDIIATNKSKYKLRSIPEELAEKTWTDVVEDNGKLVESLKGHWSSGVLVGIN
ncbi:hypothetical protein BKA70DRAFT_1095182 [Coprinopsis sp. MPI-PUGE-AT-0042]|nr:hypothetical protein BKA70DRAFT_1095182 [Coprinopsis sp. MPI-PUGE-AT-0042]